VPRFYAVPAAAITAREKSRGWLSAGADVQAHTLLPLERGVFAPFSGGIRFAPQRVAGAENLLLARLLRQA
jgi:hypothetical protein